LSIWILYEYANPVLFQISFGNSLRVLPLAGDTSVATPEGTAVGARSLMACLIAFGIVVFTIVVE
jgi:hypothetical protein